MRPCTHILRILLAAILSAGAVRLPAQEASWQVLEGLRAVAVQPRLARVRVATMGAYTRTEVSYTLPKGGPRTLLWLPAEGQHLDAWAIDGKPARALLGVPPPLPVQPITLAQAIHPGGIHIPIPEGATQVQWAWHETLPLRDNGHKYSLPAPFLHADSLVLEVDAHAQTYAPELKLPGLPRPPVFRKTANRHHLVSIWANANPGAPLRIFIPASPEPWHLHTERAGEQSAFILQSQPREAPRPRKAPRSVTLLWDASLSGAHRDHAAERAVLQRLADTWRNIDLTLLPFDISPQPPRRFSVRDADLSSLFQALDQLRYDGATDLSAIPWASLRSDILLLATDGHHNWGPAPRIQPKRPLYCISAAGPDLHPALVGACTKSGGMAPLRAATDSLVAGQILGQGAVVLKAAGGSAFQDIAIHPGDDGTLIVSGLVSDRGGVLRVSSGRGGKAEWKEKLLVAPRSPAQESPGTLRRIAALKLREAERLGDSLPATLLATALALDLPSRWTTLAAIDDTTAFLAGRAAPPFADRTRDSLAALRAKVRAYQDTLAYRSAQERLFALADEWQVRRLWWEGENAAPSNATDSLVAYTGWVRSSQDRLPVPGAMLLLRQPRDTAFVDRLGQYSFQRPGPAQPVRVQAPGYLPTEASLRASEPGRITISAANPSQRVAKAIARAAQPITVPFPTPPASAALIIDGRPYPSLPDSLAGRIHSAAWLNGTWAGMVGGYPGGARSLLTHAGKAQGWRLESAVMPVPWDTLRHHLAPLDSASDGQLLDAYFLARDRHARMPAFYLDAAQVLIRRGHRSEGVRALSNIAELGIDGSAVGRAAAAILMRQGQQPAALAILRRACHPEEPQALRELAFALEEAGQYAEASQALLRLVAADWTEVHDLHRGIEAIALNDLLGLHARRKLPSPPVLPSSVQPLPVDVRVTASWNRMDADVDLWVEEPDGSRCDHQRDETPSGGFHPTDFADGYGPEEYMVREAQRGTYRIGLDCHLEDRPNLVGACKVLVTIYRHYGSANEQREEHEVVFEGMKGSQVVAELKWQ